MSRPDPQILAALSDPRATPDQRLKACRHLIRFGHIGEAVAAVAAMEDEPKLRREVRALIKQIRAVREMGLAQRVGPGTSAPAEPGDDRAYWVVPANSDTTLIAFTGMAKRLDVSIYFMQRILGRQGMNVIYVFDWADSYYFGGVGGLGADVTETVRGLRSLCADLKTRRLICFGQSSGAYAAILYGARLGADGVLAFSPVILPVTRKRVLARIAETTGVRLTPGDTDLRVVLSGTHPVPYTKIVYGSANRADVRSARRLAGLPNVVGQVLHGVRTHGTVEHTTLDGTFAGILRDFCDEVGPGAWGVVNRPRAI